MASQAMAANDKSENSVLGSTAGQIPTDGTGTPSTAPLSEELNTDKLAGVVALDPWLGPYKDALRSRYSKAQEWIKKLNETEGGLEKFSRVRRNLFTPITASAKCVSTGL